MKSDINRLCCNRKDGGRGLNNFENTYELRTAAIRRHIIRDKERNHLLEIVFGNEANKIIRIGQQYEEIHLKSNQQEQQEDQNKISKVTEKIIETIKQKHKEKWQQILQHGLLTRMITKEDIKEMEKTHS